MRNPEPRHLSGTFQKNNADVCKCISRSGRERSSVKNADESKKTLEKSTEENRVYALKPAYQGKESNKNFRNQQIPRENHVRPRTEATQKQSGPRAQGYICYCCRRPNHRASECTHRYEYSKCCNKRGHMEQVCRAKNSETPIQFLEAADQAGASGQASDGKSVVSESNSVSELHKSYDFFPLKIYNVNDSNYCMRDEKIRADPMFLNGLINSISLTMEVVPVRMQR